MKCDCKQPPLFGITYRHLGELWIKRENSRRARRCFDLERKVWEELKCRKCEGYLRCKLNLSIMDNKLKDYFMVTHHLESVIKNYSEIFGKASYENVTALSILGCAYLKKRQYQKAIDNLLLYISSSSTMQDRSLPIFSLNCYNIGKAYHYIDEPAEASVWLEKAISIRSQSNSEIDASIDWVTADCHNYMSQIKKGKGDFVEAAFHAKASLKIYDNNPKSFVSKKVETALILVDVYDELGKIDGALKILRKYDPIKNEQKSKISVNVKQKHSQKLKEIENKSTNKLQSKYGDNNQQNVPSKITPVHFDTTLNPKRPSKQKSTKCIKNIENTTKPNTTTSTSNSWFNKIIKFITKR